jgi:DNA primase
LVARGLEFPVGWQAGDDIAAALDRLPETTWKEVRRSEVVLDEPPRPDDLRPDPGRRFARARGAALALRDLIADLGLRTLVKTTGGKGLHVHVALDRSMDVDEVREFAPEASLTCSRPANRSGTPPNSARSNGAGACSST